MGAGLHSDGSKPRVRPRAIVDDVPRSRYAWYATGDGEKPRGYDGQSVNLSGQVNGEVIGDKVDEAFYLG